VALGVAMLAVVLAAGLFPNSGTVAAQSSCPYGGCTSSTSAVPVWEYVSILVVIAAGAIIALLFIMRRRRPPKTSSTVTPWAGPPAAEAPAGPAAAYIETPEDVGQTPPAVAPTTVAEAAAPAAAAGAESGADIDSLMAELDKISTEILKKAPQKGADGKETDEGEGGAGDSGDTT
jgi:hypothetical protein